MDAHQLAAALTRRGRDFYGECRSCGCEGSFSLSMKDGVARWHCHTCQDSDEMTATPRDVDVVTPLIPPPRRKPVDNRGQIHAQTVWSRSLPISGTIAEAYLRYRGSTGVLSSTLRFAENVHHKPTRQFLPAMIAAVTVWPGDTVTGVVQTFLLPSGYGRAHVTPAKMSLGLIDGGAVRLGEPGEAMAIAERIETALSFQCTTGIPTWATISASGLERVVLPPLPVAARVTIVADDDMPSRVDATRRAAIRFVLEGRSVRIAPPLGSRLDWNDVLRGADHDG